MTTGLRIFALACAFAVLAIAAQPAFAQDDAGTDAAVEHAEPPQHQTSLAELRTRVTPVPWYERALSLVGLFAICGIAWAMSTHRKKVPWRVVGWGIGLQLIFAVIVLKTSAGLAFFSFLNDVVVGLLDFTNEGAKFVFGAYVTREFSIALNVLPTIIFFSSLMTVAYHLGLMQKVIEGIAWVMQRTMKTSGAETLSTAANIFVGQTEAPLVVKPFVAEMTLSELHAIMVGGFGSIAGGVLGAYVGMLRDSFPDIAGHMIACSVMSAPATLVVSKLMVPETEVPKTGEGAKLAIEKIDANVLDAAARGATEGMQLALNVGAMLIAFLALVAMLNFLVAWPFNIYNDAVGHVAIEPLTIQSILGVVFWPIAFLMGVPFEDCGEIAQLLGEKIVLTEFVAYQHLADMLASGTQLHQRSVVIATYALCGFANFASIAIQIGGIGAMAPERRGDLSRLGLRAMIGGALVTCMTATVAGMLL